MKKSFISTALITTVALALLISCSDSKTELPKEQSKYNKKFLQNYSGQMTEELIALEKDYRIDSLVLAFEQALYLKYPDNLNDTEWVVLAIENLEREVMNGGYELFFINSSKEVTPIIVDCLNKIGCPKTAQITQKAIQALGITEPYTVEAIDRVMAQKNKELKEKLDACDTLYYKTGESIEDKLFEYIKNNRDKIILK